MSATQKFCALIASTTLINHTCKLVFRIKLQISLHCAPAGTKGELPMFLEWVQLLNYLLKASPVFAIFSLGKHLFLTSSFNCDQCKNGCCTLVAPLSSTTSPRLHKPENGAKNMLSTSSLNQSLASFFVLHPPPMMSSSHPAALPPPDPLFTSAAPLDLPHVDHKYPSHVHFCTSPTPLSITPAIVCHRIINPTMHQAWGVAGF